MPDKVPVAAGQGPKNPRSVTVFCPESHGPAKMYGAGMSANRPNAAVALDHLTVREAMRAQIVTCKPDDALTSLAMAMATEGIHAIVLEPKLDAAPLIVTDLDLVRAALSTTAAMHARDLTHDPIVTLSADASLDQLTATMAEREVEHVLATDPDSGEPCGIVSSFDVVALIGGEKPATARTLRPGPARPLSSARSLDTARVGDVMHHGVVTCAPDTPIWLVARRMAEHRVHCIAIAGVGETGPHGRHYSWGLVDAKELVRASRRNALTEPAASIAATSPAAVDKDESLAAAAALMIDDGTSHVVVIDRSGLPVGMVSTLDVVSVLAASR
jgi:CBS domain-containing protein